MPSRLQITTLRVVNVRNIETMVLEPAARFNVIAGDNGQGKTSVLEAIYFLATSRSFRAERLREVVREGTSLSVVAAEIEEGPQRHEQRAAIQNGRRQLAIDGKSPTSLGQYATRTPVVVFHPGDLALASGGATIRRLLLDRIALYVEPASAECRSRYRRALRERQRLLDTGQRSSTELDVFERLVATAGAELERFRQRASEHLARALGPAFARMAAPNLVLGVKYVPGGSTDSEVLLAELFTRRERDARRRAATFGPHRADLELSVEGRSARHHASQGQQRILSLAVKLAELECVATVRGVAPLLLLDDVSSELDPTRTGAVYDFLRETQSQVFVTTTRPELFTTPGVPEHQRRDFRLVSGAFVV